MMNAGARKAQWQRRIRENIKLILTVILLLMTVQIVALYFVNERMKNDQYARDAGSRLKECALTFDQLIENAIQTSITAYDLHEIKYMLLSPKITYNDLLAFRSNVLKLCNNPFFAMTNPFSSITNMYVFNGHTQTMYTSALHQTPLQDMRDGPTKDILSLQNRQRIFVYLDTEDALLFNGNTDAALRLAYVTDFESRSVVFADISLSGLRDTLNQYQRAVHGGAYLVNEDARFLISSDPALARALAEDLQNLTREDETAPVFRTYLGQSYLVLRETSAKSGIRLYSLIPKNRIVIKNTASMLMINVSIVVIVCLLFGLLAVFRYICESTREHERYQKMLDQAQRLRQLQKSRQSLANCLFYPGLQDLDFAKKLLRVENGEARFSLLRLSLLRADAHDENMPAPAREEELLTSDLAAACGESMEARLRATLIYTRETSLYYLIPGEATDIDEAFEACRLSVQANMNGAISGYISDIGPLEELPELFKQVNALAEYQFLLEKPVFLTPAFPKERGTSNAEEIFSQIHDLVETINGDTAEQKLARLFDMIGQLRVEDAKNAVWLLFFRLYNLLNGEQLNKAPIGKATEQFNSIDSLSAMRAFLRDMINSIRAANRSALDGKKEYLVQRVYSIIEKEYRNPEVCADTIADAMQMSKAYLARKFRGATGVSIGDAINKRRLRAFENLLVTTDQNVKTMMTDVGGLNANYFFVLFKKQYGMTPTEYRAAKKGRSARDY